MRDKKLTKRVMAIIGFLLPVIFVIAIIERGIDSSSTFWEFIRNIGNIVYFSIVIFSLFYNVVVLIDGIKKAKKHFSF